MLDLEGDGIRCGRGAVAAYVGMALLAAAMLGAAAMGSV